MNPVSIDTDNNIAIVTIDNPPVNALSHSVRVGLLAAVQKIDTDDTIHGAILLCAGSTFIAGADIREFGQPPKEPSLPDVIDRIERSDKPWVTAIHGTALGGGLEVALGCHYRITESEATLGFPEVNLGLIPGAGGTIRTPRLIALDHAVTLVTGGKKIGAAQAKAWGITDQIFEGDPRSGGLAFFKTVAGKPLPDPISQRPPKSFPGDAEWEEIFSQVRKRAKGALAPLEAAKAIRDALILPVNDALAKERARFVTLRDGDQSKALRHMFFAENSASKLPELKGIAPRNIVHVGIVGGGTMGTGIATACLLATRIVTMVEQDDAALQKGLKSVRSHLDSSLKRGIVDQVTYNKMLKNLTGAATFEAFADADLVIEAVFEDMALKKKIFAKLDAATRDDAILATNTSYLDVNEIAGTVTDPSRVVGLHFFSPAHVMKLLEVIRTDTVSSETLTTVFSFAKLLKKIAVPAGVCDGFIGNRILSAYRKQCDYMLEDGALPQEIDAAMTGFGFPMGIFAMQDLAGLDIGWATRKRLAATRDPNERYVSIADRLCELGRFGRKTGAGWYLYAEGSTKSEIDPLVEEIILEEAAKKEIARKSFSLDEIMRRILEAMQREGEVILEQGIAASPEAIDVVMVNGYGFPRWRGGPMFMRTKD